MKDLTTFKKLSKSNITQITNINNQIIDSLVFYIKKMFDWLENLPVAAKGTVYGALIGATVSFVIYLLTFFFKDYAIPIIFEKRKIKNESKQAFKKYKNPLIIASEALAYRLKEIFQNRSYFLLADYPKTDFYNYKYINTLYRLCSLIGYIRALRLEVLYSNVANNSKIEKIDKALKDFESSLADGQESEVLVLKNIFTTWNIDYKTISHQDLKNLGCEMDDIINDINYANKVKSSESLEEKQQIDLVNKLFNCITTFLNLSLKIDDLKHSDVIKEISVKEAYIYRDWQQAIGDMMLQTTLTEIKGYQLIGYKIFEEFYNQTDTEEKKWITRIEKLFLNVDIKRIDERFDFRIKQLKRIYCSIINIIIAFSSIDTGIEPISKKSLNDLQLFKSSLKI